jgi:hypothetical protein
MKRFACALLLAAAPAFAQQAAPTTPQDPPLVAQAPRDADFGVSTRHAGLQRRIEMYQWTRDGDSYAKAWRAHAVDSAVFAPGHRNPSMPLHDREWRAQVSVDGKPLAPELIDKLGEWRGFHPNFSALPGNMSATFQPEGEGLGSADNPLAPRIGDLRITWRALVLPDLGDRLVLDNGAWTLRAPPAAAGTASDADGANAKPKHEWRWWWLSGAGIVLVVVLVAAQRRRSST